MFVSDLLCKHFNMPPVESFHRREDEESRAAAAG